LEHRACSRARALRWSHLTPYPTPWELAV